MSHSTVDQLLQNLSGGEHAAFDDLMCEIYPNLLVIARALLRDQPVGHPFEASDLVHEAYLKMARYRDVQWRGQSHFFGAVTQTMRRLLIDHARAGSTLKREGVYVPLTQAEDVHGDESSSRSVEWNDLLSCLAKAHPRWTKVVECRCSQGLTIEETAKALNVSHYTVSADWRRAQAWLGRELGRAPGANGHGPLTSTGDSTTTVPDKNRAPFHIMRQKSLSLSSSRT